MDRMIYLSMTGAKALMERQDALSHNLANASTDGFRADLMTARAVPIRSEGTATTRVFNVETSTGFDGKSGPIRQTGNPLDLAIRDNGWFAVQAADGSEAYTRDGGLVVDEQGNLRTRRGQTVLGDGGPISVPAGADVQVADDGPADVEVGQGLAGAGAQLGGFGRLGGDHFEDGQDVVVDEIVGAAPCPCAGGVGAQADEKSAPAGVGPVQGLRLAQQPGE